MGTNLDAVSATHAALLEEHQVWLGAFALRIVAPPARQWTPFEKDRGSNARAVVQGIAHDVKEEPGRFRRRGVGGVAANSGLVVYSNHLSNTAGASPTGEHYTVPGPSHTFRQEPSTGSIKGDVKRKHSSLSAGREWIFDIQPLGCGCHGNLMELGWRGGGLNGCCFIPAV
jgi:hypothetical protein